MEDMVNSYEPSGKEGRAGWLMMMLGGLGLAAVLGVICPYLVVTIFEDQKGTEKREEEAIFSHLLITLEQRKQRLVAWGSRIDCRGSHSAIRF